MSKRWQRLTVACGLGLSVLSACGSRQHMSEGYGEQSHRFFVKQRVNANATQGSPSGLDSEEAALIQSSYKNSLGHERAPTEASSRVMLLQESDDKAQQ